MFIDLLIEVTEMTEMNKIWNVNIAIVLFNDKPCVMLSLT